MIRNGSLKYVELFLEKGLVLILEVISELM